MRDVERVLLVEDDPMMMRTLRRAVQPLAASVTCVDSVAAAKAALGSPFDLVLLDVKLPDGSGVTVAELAARAEPAPMVVALSGAASADEAFRLAALGVRGYLAKPFELEELTSLIARVRSEPPVLAPIVKACVGHADLKQVQTEVRQTMLGQAMALADGNRSTAAKLLAVTRQAVQRMLRSTS